MDLAISAETGDLVLEDGDLAVVREGEAVAQHLRTRFRFFLGEWFLDQREGIPYFREILGIKRPNPLVLSSMYRRIALETPGISSVPELSSSFDPTSRTLRLDFSAVLEDGGIVSTRNDGPFIVEV